MTSSYSYFIKYSMFFVHNSVTKNIHFKERTCNFIVPKCEDVDKFQKDCNSFSIHKNSNQFITS